MKQFYATVVLIVLLLIALFITAQYMQERQQVEEARQRFHDDINDAINSPNPIQREMGRRAANRDVD